LTELQHLKFFQTPSVIWNILSSGFITICMYALIYTAPKKKKN